MRSSFVFFPGYHLLSSGAAMAAPASRALLPRWVPAKPAHTHIQAGHPAR